METLHNINVWTLAVLDHWHGYVSGGAIAFGLELIEKFREWKPSKKVFFGIVAIGFICSMYSTWAEERERYEQLEVRLTAELKWKFLNVGTAKAPEGALIILWGEVNNIGLMPSTAQNWHLSVQFPRVLNTSDTLIYTNIDVKREPFILDSENGIEQALPWEKFLPDITAADSIATGAGRVGFVTFLLPGMPQDRLIQGTVLTLSFDDVNGKTQQSSWVMHRTAVQSRPPYIPGMGPTRVK